MNADLRALLKDLRHAGWRVEQSRHLRLYPPGSATPVRISCTPSDYRAIQNILTTLRHAVDAEDPRR